MTTPAALIADVIPRVRTRAQPAVLPAERVARCVSVAREADIVAAVRAARAEGGTVRAVGAYGSKNTCFRTAGTLLRLDRYDRVLAVRGNRVVAQAGVTVRALNAVLDAHGLALPTHGEWAGATVAGAVATGVHGGSLVHGVFPTSVQAMRLVTADGEILDAPRGSPLFAHAGVSLGLLGVTSTITFECAEAFHLGLHTRVVSFARYLREHDAETRSHEFYSAIWIPTAGRVITSAANRVPASGRPVPRRPRYSFATLVLSALSRNLDVHAFRESWFTETATDRWDRILSPIDTSSRKVRLVRRLTRDWREAEFAVPLERAAETLDALEGLLARHREALRIPVGLRASAADDFTLSPCQGRATFWIALFYREMPGLTAALRELFEGVRARCHWGKHVDLSPLYLRAQYSGWGAFQETRASLDPDGVFVNDFTRRFVS
jgi:L-gulonolactone oxidase